MFKYKLTIMYFTSNDIRYWYPFPDVIICDTMDKCLEKIKEYNEKWYSVNNVKIEKFMVDSDGYEI